MYIYYLFVVYLMTDSSDHLALNGRQSSEEDRLWKEGVIA
jgi:hypothetical protein